jgi:hypothetical protein
MSQIPDISKWVFWGPLRKILSFSSPKFLYILENFFSFFSYHILWDRREVIKQELRKSFGDEWSLNRIEKAVRESFRIYFASKFRMFFIARLNRFNIYEYIEV